MLPNKRARTEPWLPRINDQERTMLVRQFFNANKGQRLPTYPSRLDITVLVVGASANLRTCVLALNTDACSCGIELTEHIDRDGFRSLVWKAGCLLKSHYHEFHVRLVRVGVQAIVDAMRRREALALTLRADGFQHLIEYAILPYLDPTEGVVVDLSLKTDWSSTT